MKGGVTEGKGPHKWSVDVSFSSLIKKMRKRQSHNMQIYGAHVSWSSDVVAIYGPHSFYSWTASDNEPLAEEMRHSVGFIIRGDSDTHFKVQAQLKYI
ncbi:hypothetical protein FCV25MIE_08237 [Fagus crenata]